LRETPIDVLEPEKGDQVVATERKKGQGGQDFYEPTKTTLIRILGRNSGRDAFRKEEFGKKSKGGRHRMTGK